MFISPILVISLSRLDYKIEFNSLIWTHLKNWIRKSPS